MTRSLGNLEGFTDLQLEIEAELARTCLTLRQILELDRNSIVPLPHAANERVEVVVGGAAVARGTVVITGEAIAIRLGEVREEA
jgi:flagellar motor switch protein FliN